MHLHSFASLHRTATCSDAQHFFASTRRCSNLRCDNSPVPAHGSNSHCDTTPVGLTAYFSRWPDRGRFTHSTLRTTQTTTLCHFSAAENDTTPGTRVVSCAWAVICQQRMLSSTWAQPLPGPTLGTTACGDVLSTSKSKSAPTFAITCKWLAETHERVLCDTTTVRVQ